MELELPMGHWEPAHDVPVYFFDRKGKWSATEHLCMCNINTYATLDSGVRRSLQEAGFTSLSDFIIFIPEVPYNKYNYPIMLMSEAVSALDGWNWVE